jgi:hypothetical protein
VSRQSRGQVTPCPICTVHKETRSAGFLVEPQNQGRRVFRFWPQNQQLRFGNLSLKITTTVSWFGPQNHAGDSLSIAPQNRWEEDSVDTRRDLAACFTAKQVGLGFQSFPQNWWRSDGGWCMWHHHGSRVKTKSKTDGLMRQVASDTSTPTLLFL